MKKNVFTVENAKVANVTYSYHPQGRSGYIAVGDGIVHVNVTSVEFNLKKREVKTCLVDNSGKEYVRDGIFAMYETPADYEKNNAIRPHTWEAVNIIKCADRCRFGGYSWVETDAKTETEPQYGYVEAWCFEDGEPVAVPVVVNVVIDDGKGSGHITDGHLPEKCWGTRNEAFLYNEYKVVDEDGEEFIEQGVQKRLALTDEQQKIVDELNAVFKKALEANIGFLWDREDCECVEVYNRDNVYEFNYEVKTHEGGDNFHIRDINPIKTDICFYDYCSSDDYRFAMKPTPRQQKAWKKAHPDSK